MDKLFETVVSEDNVRLAIDLTLRGMTDEMFANPIQIDYCRAHKDEIAAKIRAKMLNYKTYKNNLSIRALKRKNDFAIRNFIILDIEDNIARTAIALVIANELESHLIDNCFSSRRGDQIKKNERLTEEFAPNGWQKFHEWQAAAIHRYSLLLKTDISSFFDSISHEHLLGAMKSEFDLVQNDPLVVLTSKLLKVKHIYRAGDKPVEISHGITIGSPGNHIFANLMLHRIDKKMSSIPGIAYGRYVDDIRIFGDTKDTIKYALNLLQMKLFDIGLSMNGAKTHYTGNPRLLKRLISEKFFTYLNIDEMSHLKEPTPSKIVRIKKDLDAFKDSQNKDIDASLNGPHRDLDSWRGVKLKGNSDRVTGYLHTINQTIDEEPDKIGIKEIKRLFHFLIEDPKNEKYVCWLIARIIIDFRYHEVDRRAILGRVLYLMRLEKISSYATYRILHFLSNQKKYFRYDYSVVNQFLASDFKKEFKFIIRQCLAHPSILLNIIGLYALKAYNDNHTKDQRIRINLKLLKEKNPVFQENRMLLRRIPKIVQKRQIISLEELISAKDIQDILDDTKNRESIIVESGNLSLDADDSDSKS